MKKIIFLILFICTKTAFAQTNIAVPNYSALSNGLPATGKVNFYLNGSGFSTNVGHGANAVAFYEENMFVAYDDGLPAGNGILWYKGVSFATGAFTYTSVVILNTNQRTLGVVADAVTGDVYVANYNGTITRFIRQVNAPFYTTAATTSMTFWSGGNVAEASGLYVDISTRILWAVSSANNQAAVCKLSTFGTANTIKYITGPTSPVNFIQKPQGISEDGSGNMWIANNTNNEILKINISTVNAINNELNANDYTPKVLTTPANIQNYSVGVSTYKLGGLAYDYQYSNKMFVNSQLPSSSNTTPVYEFNPSVATPIFSPSIGLSQVPPGIGQAGIIPCTILAPPPTPLANSITVNPGQTATLTATGCGTDQTYIWKEENNVRGYSASYTTVPIQTNTNYTVSCVRGLGCESVARNVLVNIPPVISTPFVSNVVVPRLNLDSLFFYLGNGLNPSNKYRAIGITPSGISFYNSDMFATSNTTSGAGTLSWYQNVSLNPYNLTPATTPTYLTPIFNFNGVGSSKGVAVDQQGNIYVASSNGLLSKFYRSQTAPFYANNRQVGVRVGTSNNDIMGGLSYDETTATIWMTNFTTKKIVVINAAEIPALPAVLTANIPVSATKDTYVKIIEPPAALQYAFDDPLGIAFVLASGVWVSSNVNQGVVSRIKQTTITSILADLNNNIYTTKTLTASDIDVYTSFASTGGLGNRFGALTYDNIYSKKLILSDQPAAVGPTKNMISIDPFAVNPLSTFALTQYKQTFGGHDQVGIIPCSLLPTPANPVVAGITINEGATATLTASGCTGTQNYQWRDGFSVVGGTATFVSPVLNANKTYTAYCVNGIYVGANITCVSSGVNVQVTVVPCVVPSAATVATANPTVVTPGNTATLSASGCAVGNTYLWKEGATTISTAATFTSPVINFNTTYTVFCVNGNCISAGTTVTVNTNAPLTHTIANCTILSPSTVPFRVGTFASKTYKVFLNIITPGTYTIIATGPSFSGSVTQAFAVADPNAFVWLPINYNSLGTAGNQSVVISSADLNVATCTLSIPVYNPPKCSFTDCNNGMVTGSFVEGTPSTGTLTIAIAVTQAGSATFQLDEFGNNRMSGSLTTNLTLGQTSVTIPFNYDGTGPAGNGGQFTVSSIDAVGQGANAGFCFGPNYVILAPNTPCPNSVVISQAANPSYVANAVVKAAEYITTLAPPLISISTANSNKLTYQAGKSITLSPGFSINGGAIFLAKIAGCAN
jgi:hypothetical protein